jgi:hypothetical protein
MYSVIMSHDGVLHTVEHTRVLSSGNIINFFRVRGGQSPYLVQGCLIEYMTEKVQRSAESLQPAELSQNSNASSPLGVNVVEGVDEDGNLIMKSGLLLVCLVLLLLSQARPPVETLSRWRRVKLRRGMMLRSRTLSPLEKSSLSCLISVHTRLFEFRMIW